MRKTLSFVLAVLMVFSTLIIISPTVFAIEEDDQPITGEAVAISTPAGFAAMDPAGNYYLTADLTIDATYLGEFTGTLDGKGHTVTLSVPMFTEINATVSNLNLAGSISASASGSYGALSNKVNGGVYENIKNAASVVTQTSNGYNAGGFFGITVKGGSYLITLKNCTNIGAVAGYLAGGFIGKAECPFNMENCVNLADVTGGDCGGGMCGWPVWDFTLKNCVNGSETVAPKVTSTSDGAGGMVGYISANTAGTFDECKNYGTIEGNKSAGGLMGHSGDKCKLTYLSCINFGAVTGRTDSTGGIAGLTNGGAADNKTTTKFENCVNNGLITTVKDTAGGICGYVGGNSTATFQGCLNTGAVQHTDASGNYSTGGVLGHTSGEAFFESCTNTADVTNAIYRAGGIAGTINTSSSFTNCFNSGNITGNKTAGGIVANAGGNSSTANLNTVFTSCGNTGKITAGSDTGSGIAAYVYASGSRNIAPEFYYCYNTGDVSGNEIVAAIAGYYNGTTKLKIVACYNLGKMTCLNEEYQSCAVYYSNHTAPADAEGIVGMYYINDCAEYDSRYYPVTGQDGDGNNVKTEQYVALNANITSADVASGKLCYLLNEAAGKEVYYQDIGVDGIPLLENRETSVQKLSDGTYSNGITLRGYQVSADMTGETFNIRFVATIDDLRYTRVGFEIKEANSGKTWKGPAEEAYSELLASSKDGVPYQQKALRAYDDLNAKYIVAGAVVNIPTGAAYSFTVTAYLADANGTVYTSTYIVNIAANGEITYAAA